MSLKLPASISGFTAIPVSYSSSSTHIIYARAHIGSKKNKVDIKGKGPAFPEGRTLFLVNVPPDATEREISLLFKSSGTVERVVFDRDDEVEEQAEESDSEHESDGDEGMQGDEDSQEQPRKKRKLTKEERQPPPQVVPLPPRPDRMYRKTGQTAHVIFLDTSSLTRALTVPSKPKTWPQDESSSQGLSYYETLYASLRPPLDVVKAHADSWMELFEYEQEKKRQKSKYRKGEAIVDEDGFTLVTRGGAYGQTLGGGVGVASKKFQDEVRKGSGGGRIRKNKKEPKEKDAFYAFQIHEKKRKGTYCRFNNIFCFH